MRGGFLKRLRTPAGVSFLALVLLLGGGLSLMIVDGDTGLTRLTSATSRDDVGVAQALVRVTPDRDVVPTTSHRVRPIVECVDRSGGGTWVAYFGYQSANDGSVDVAIGPDNHLTPSALDGVQPTSFGPGTSRFQFAVVLHQGEAVGWSLQGRTATAAGGSPECDPGAYDDTALPTPSDLTR